MCHHPLRNPRNFVAGNPRYFFKTGILRELAPLLIGVRQGQEGLHLAGGVLIVSVTEHGGAGEQSDHPL